jgi:hypothetical protein
MVEGVLFFFSVSLGGGFSLFLCSLFKSGLILYRQGGLGKAFPSKLYQFSFFISMEEGISLPSFIYKER